MALSKKPVKSTVDVEALILKGGSVPTSSSPTPPLVRAAEPPPSDEKDKKIMLQLRLPAEIVQEIDGLIEKRVLKISRHAWFLEALSEKILKERG